MAITAGQTALASDFIASSAGSADAAKAVKTDSSGLIDQTFLVKSFGNGSDGNVTISSPTSLTRDMYYNDLTVNDTLTTNGWRVFVKGTLSGNGKFAFNGNDGSAGIDAVNSVTSLGGAGGSATTGYFANQAGASGPNGVINTSGNGGNSTANLTGALGSQGGSGGGGGSGTSGGGGGGGNGGSITAPLSPIGITRYGTIMGLENTTTGATIKYTGSSGGGSGGSGGGGGSVNNPGGGGGGGGGAGGYACIVYLRKTWSGSYTLTGGSGGAGGAKGGGSGVAGSAGSTGTTGVSKEIFIGETL